MDDKKKFELKEASAMNDLNRNNSAELNDNEPEQVVGGFPYQQKKGKKR